MNCVCCSGAVKDVQHIAIDDNGDPIVLCEECYNKFRIFYEEVKHRGKVKS